MWIVGLWPPRGFAAKVELVLSPAMPSEPLLARRAVDAMQSRELFLRSCFFLFRPLPDEVSRVKDVRGFGVNQFALEISRGFILVDDDTSIADVRETVFPQTLSAVSVTKT